MGICNLEKQTVCLLSRWRNLGTVDYIHSSQLETVRSERVKAHELKSEKRT